MKYDGTSPPLFALSSPRLSTPSSCVKTSPAPPPANSPAVAEIWLSATSLKEVYFTATHPPPPPPPRPLYAFA